MTEESLFTIGNGYVGIRGCFEEGYPTGESIRGSYVNGLFERVPMVHAEMAYGFPTVQDKQPRITDTQTIQIYLDGEKAQMIEGKTDGYTRRLDYQKGEVVRTYRFKSISGKMAELAFKRMASFSKENFALYHVEVKYEGDIQILSCLDAAVENYSDKNDPRVGQDHTRLMSIEKLAVDHGYEVAVISTKASNIKQVTLCHHHVESPQRYKIERKIMETGIETCVSGKGHLKLTKKVVFTDSLRFETPYDKACKLMQERQAWSYEDFNQEQQVYLEQYWDKSDIIIEGDEDDQNAIRFMLYQLLQSVGKDPYANISAKGLSGEGYEGHYFWDTEIYVCPLLSMNQRALVKNLLLSRYRMLQVALERAKELGHPKGAAYAWRTISGIECSGYFPAGTAQYHINADIAYAFIQYYLYTDDLDFMAAYGAEVIFETARIWLSIGHFYKGEFHIHSVTGPDEYTAVVNNNYYTNAMAKHHLDWACKFYDILSNLDSPVIGRLGLSQDEIKKMREASDKMCLVYDETLALYAQDDAFLSKPIWPFKELDPSKKPLLLHYHPLTIYRHQVLKQPDVLLAHFLVEKDTPLIAIKNAFKYYEPLTTHDSSLSTCLYGIMASRCGFDSKAYDYFKESIFLDLKDTHKNTKDGLHVANMSGTVLSVVAGFGGYRLTANGIELRPKLPHNWTRYQFKVHYKNSWIEVSVSKTVVVRLISGESCNINVYDKDYLLKKGEDITVALDQIKGFVFDMDGVLTETSKAHFEAWQELANKLGFTLPPALEDEVRGISRMASLERVLKAGGLATQFSESEKIEMATEKNNLYLERIKSYHSGDLSPGTLDLLVYLKKHGYKIALASASKNAPFLLKAMGIEQYFDAVVDPQEIANGKPAPDIFLKACEMIDLQPHECVGVEDAYAGVESIIAAGLKPIGIGSKELLTNCEEVYENLDVYLKSAFL